MGFNNISTRLGLFYVQRLGKCVYIYAFVVNGFSDVLTSSVAWLRLTAHQHG